ncbi:MAG: NUDIX domain-containing protein [Clostridia bacterium]|nr:NUDIX domain-containing protein [Clostridia bacterium]
MAELRDLYDINSNKTDKTYRKGEPIPEGYYPMVVMVVIRNSKGEFLMQKRVESKGGDWGVTGGHPKSGETPLEGIVTEVKEELGLDFSNETFIEYDSGCDGKDCYKMYFVNKDVDIKEMKIQEEELSEVRWFSMDELKHMVEINELNNDQIACFVKVCNFLKNEKIDYNNN